MRVTFAKPQRPAERPAPQPKRPRGADPASIIRVRQALAQDQARLRRLAHLLRR